MRKADRLFQLVNLIRVHQPICAEKLASRIGVSVRSVYRYIDDVSISGIPIYGTAGVGYSLGEDFQMPPLSLNRLELEALMLGMDMLSTCADPHMSAAVRTLLSKVSASSEQHRIDPPRRESQGTGYDTHSDGGQLVRGKDCVSRLSCGSRGIYCSRSTSHD